MANLNNAVIEVPIGDLNVTPSREALEYNEHTLKGISKAIDRVMSEIAERCEVQLAYSIGVAEPVSILVDTFGTGKMDDERITKLVSDHFDFRPYKIIKQLNLKRPIYSKLAAYGHFGREGYPWEVKSKNKKFIKSVKDSLLWKIV